MNFMNKRVLITGGSRGLGAALAKLITERGGHVCTVARSEADQPIRGVRHLIGDIANKDDIHRISGQAAALLGGIDVLINNASTLGANPLRALMDTDCEQLEAALVTNVLGPFRLTKAIAGPMVLRGEGTIVFISSDAASSAYATWGAYGASKAAADQLARVLAVEEPTLRVISIDPGEMNTQMHRDAMPGVDVSTLMTPLQAAQNVLAKIEGAS